MPTDVFLFLPPREGADYSEAYPYGPIDDSFNEHLGIDIVSTMKNRYPALAVVSGMVRLIPPTVDLGSATPRTGTLVLLPIPTEFSNLHSVLGGSPVVFIYHNFDIDNISTYLDDQIRRHWEEFAEAAEEEEGEEYSPVEDFLNGGIAVSVSGGNELALAGIRVDDPDSCRLGFEIAFIPSGLRIGIQEEWDWLQRFLVQPNIRRLDPMSFYADVLRSPSSDIRIATVHADHPLFTLTTRRILVELRDEYDLPFQGEINSHTFTDRNRGTVVRRTVNPGDEPPDAAIPIPVEYPNYVFTDLPSGSSASESPSKNLTPPAHWAMQMIFMADVDNTANWFAPNRSLQRYTENNRVTFLIDGVATFRAMVEAIRTVNRRGHFLWIAYWFIDDNFNLIHADHSSRFRRLLQDMPHTPDDGGPVQVRALLWDSVCGRMDVLEWELGTQNNAEFDHINVLPGDCIAILDDNTKPFGSHHQKIMIVNGGTEGPVAFCGGIDINPNRCDDTRHVALSPYHDVHAKVEGPAVNDLSQTFTERWNCHQRRPSGDTLSPILSVSPAGSQYVQVTRTYPSGVANAPPQENSTLDAICRAIERANKYIYFEDQFAFPYAGPCAFDASEDDLSITTALRNALGRIEFLIIVIPNHIGLPQYRYRRRNFIRSLKDVAPDKVYVFYLERVRGPRGLSRDIPDCEPYFGELPPGRIDSGSAFWPDEIYVHSKIWIIDDIYAKIGTANCNRRSLTHDSEVDIHIIDGALWNGGRQFARDFRIALWAEHLNMARTEAQRAKLEDPIFALRFWQPPPGGPDGARIRQYHENLDIESRHSDFAWNRFWDPYGR